MTWPLSSSNSYCLDIISILYWAQSHKHGREGWCPHHKHILRYQVYYSPFCKGHLLQSTLIMFVSNEDTTREQYLRCRLLQMMRMLITIVKNGVTIQPTQQHGYSKASHVISSCSHSNILGFPCGDGKWAKHQHVGELDLLLGISLWCGPTLHMYVGFKT